MIITSNKNDRISEKIGPYLGENRTVSRNKNDRISEEMLPYLGRNRTVPFCKRNLLTLQWKLDKTKEKATIYMSTTNHYNKGGKDEWVRIGEVPAQKCSYTINLSDYPTSKFYKFVVATPNNHLNRWMRK